MPEFTHLGIYPGPMGMSGGSAGSDTFALTLGDFAKLYWRLKTISISISGRAFTTLDVSASGEVGRTFPELFPMYEEEYNLCFEGAGNEAMLHQWVIPIDGEVGVGGGTFDGHITISFPEVVLDGVVTRSQPVWHVDEGTILLPVHITGVGSYNSPGTEYGWEMSNVSSEVPVSTHTTESEVQYTSGATARPSIPLYWNFDAGMNAGEFECTIILKGSYNHGTAWLEDYESNVRQNDHVI